MQGVQVLLLRSTVTQFCCRDHSHTVYTSVLYIHTSNSMWGDSLRWSWKCVFSYSCVAKSGLHTAISSAIFENSVLHTLIVLWYSPLHTLIVLWYSPPCWHVKILETSCWRHLLLIRAPYTCKNGVDMSPWQPVGFKWRNIMTSPVV